MIAGASVDGVLTAGSALVDCAFMTAVRPNQKQIRTAGNINLWIILQTTTFLASNTFEFLVSR